MRLVHLSVQNFQCIESAEVDFGPGLNVLYGPNDLGKSSLAWAIRAVLLLQHNSSVHERFVSWYGDAEPRVALTLCDDDDRIWKVSKTFGSGTAGRSALETSRDGRTFIPDVKGREVDDKLRTMFGWGVQRPGGQGPRGLPESFLTQVLLAEQDNVRKVLFETSLAKDPDEAGRLRLIEALGALAQDPLFKQILDETQESVDKAFTPKGRKKKTAGSPFIGVAELLTSLQREHEDLSQKVRETELAETKIRELTATRDELHRDLDKATETLTTIRRQFEARQRRDGFHERLQMHLATVRAVEQLQRKVDHSDSEIVRLKAAIEAGGPKLQAATAAAKRAEEARDEARRHLDALTHDDVEHERRTRELEEQKKTAQERLDEAERAVERAAESLRQARGLATEVASAAAAALDKARLAKAAEDIAAEAVAEVGRAQQAHSEAQQRVRDASSDDRARARELERKDVDNRRLKAAAERAVIESHVRRAVNVGQAVTTADKARTIQAALATKVAQARDAVAAEETKLATIDASDTELHHLDVFGDLRQLRGVLDAAAQAQASADEAREAAAALRQQETTLRAKVPNNLPTAEAIAALRDLREQRRLADARLGGGISVTVRPKQTIALTAKADGVAVPAASTGEPVVLTANQVLLLGLGDLADIEVTAGEEGARKAAATLQERWHREGSRTLAEHNVETIEQLDTLRRDADAALRAADQCQRDAALQEERAARARTTIDASDSTARLAELDAELGDADRGALAARFERLGDRWQSTLKRLSEENATTRKALVMSLEELRGQFTRLQTQLDVQAEEALTLENEATRRQAELTGHWSALVAHHEKALAAADRNLEDLGRQAELLAGATSDDQQAAEKLLAEAAGALELATERSKERQAASQLARDAAVQAVTKLDGARTRARELDLNAFWSSELESSAPALSLASWQDAVTSGGELRDQRKVARDTADERLLQLASERSLAIQGARTAFAEADKLATTGRTHLGTLQAEQDALNTKWSQAQVAAAEMKVELARASVDDAERAIVDLRKELLALEDEIGVRPIDAEEVSNHEQLVERLSGQLRDAQEDLAKARGGLEHVGGAIVRERLRELDQAIQHARERERQIEVEFDAWKLLLETLRASESTEGAHLGRALVGPVSNRFRQLTGGRYDSLELGAHLETSGLQAAGELRPISALSAGTQDQLATLLRLCIAEHLHSAIILDDHLSQSDPARVAWFNSVLRGAAQHVQIILITCRPGELLASEELPRSGEPNFSGAAGLLRSVDLSALIRRFASTTVTSPSAPQSQHTR